MWMYNVCDDCGCVSPPGPDMDCNCPSCTICGCIITDRYLFLHVESQPENPLVRSYAHNATLTRMQRPADVSSYNIETEGWFSTEVIETTAVIFGETVVVNRYRYHFGCDVSGLFVLQGLMVPDSPLDFPRVFDMVSWSLNSTGNTCDPFRLTSGETYNDGLSIFRDQGITIDGSGTKPYPLPPIPRRCAVITGCPCDGVGSHGRLPNPLYMHVTGQPIGGLTSLVFPATLNWMAKPADLSTYLIDDPGYYSEPVTSNDGYYIVRYYFGCSLGFYFVSLLTVPSSPLGYPGQSPIMQWLVGLPGNTCLTATTPFSLTNGASGSQAYMDQGITINGSPDNLPSHSEMVPRPCCVSIAGCPCSSSPPLLNMTSSNPESNNRIFQSAVLVYGPTPQALLPLGIGHSSYLSTSTYTDLTTGDPFYYHFACYIGYYLLTRVYVTSLYGSPFRDSTRYRWPIGLSGNTCQPFSLIHGQVFAGGDPSCIVSISE